MVRLNSRSKVLPFFLGRKEERKNFGLGREGL
jgi:hypothetical protein